MKKWALVVEGGGITGGAWCAGVLKTFFDYYGPDFFSAAYGYSAAAYTLAYYAAGQVREIERLWRDRSHGLFALRNFFKKGKYMLDLEWMEEVLSSAADGLDVVAVERSPLRLIYVLTRYPAFDAVYMTPSAANIFALLKGSASILLLHPPARYGNLCFADGGYSDPVPVQKAIEDGYCPMVISPRKRGEYRNSIQYRLYDLWLRVFHPHTSAFAGSANRKIHSADRFIEDAFLPVIRPRQSLAACAVTSNRTYINALVNLGLEDGKRFIRGLQRD